VCVNNNNEPHNWISAEFFDDGLSRNTQDAVDDMNDAIEGTDICLYDGCVDSTAFDRDSDVVLRAVSTEVEPSATIRRFNLTTTRSIIYKYIRIMN
jgi:hypothetical protein